VLSQLYILSRTGGPGWIRTSEGVKPADLQSAPVGHFGTDPIRRRATYRSGYALYDSPGRVSNRFQEVRVHIAPWSEGILPS
jgi:hypothetical protein